MALYPTNVVIDPKQIERLTRTFKNSRIQIASEINTATNFGVANRKAILRQIDAILFDLGTDVNAFVAKELPNYYKGGADISIRQLNNVGAKVNVSEGFNRVHRQAVSALVDDTAKAFAESIRGVSRSASLLLGKATREAITQQIAKGVIGGDPLKAVRLQIKGVLQEQGLTALVDKGGKRWSLDTYSEMLFRTKVVETRNRGFTNRMVENGHDLAQVSDHNTSHDGPRGCKRWEGKIISLTGATKGFPTLAQAEAAGLFHPNCQHAINALIPSLARKTRAYDPATGKLGAPGESLNRSSKPK